MIVNRRLASWYQDGSQVAIHQHKRFCVPRGFVRHLGDGEPRRPAGTTEAVQKVLTGRRLFDDLYIVGFYHPNGEWELESEYSTREEAAKRVAYLNGSSVATSVATEKDEA